MAFPAIAALIAGGTGSALVLGAIGEIGLTMSVVGAVTGNAKLMKVGGVLGIVGGVGGMMAKAGTAAASAGGSGAFVGEGAASGVPGWDAAAGSGVGTGSGAFLGEGVESGIGGWDAPGTEALNFDQVVTDASGALEVTPDAMSPDALKLGAGPEKLKLPEAPTPEALTPKSELISQPTSPVENTAQESFRQSEILKQNAGEGVLPPAGSKDYFKTFMEWIKENKDAVKLIGEGAQGLANGPMNAAKKDYYKQATAESKSRYGHGNEVARFAPRPLIGAA